MDLRIIHVRNELDVSIPIRLVLANIVTKYRDNRLIVPLRTNICLWMIRGRRLMLISEYGMWDLKDRTISFNLSFISFLKFPPWPPLKASIRVRSLVHVK